MTETLLQIALGLAAFFGTCMVGLMGWLVLVVMELNKNIAVVVQRVDSHEKRFDSNEKRIEVLETQ